MAIFKVEAEGDTAYLQADSLDEAKGRFEAVVGKIPESLLTWTPVDALPDGEEFL